MCVLGDSLCLHSIQCMLCVLNLIARDNQGLKLKQVCEKHVIKQLLWIIVYLAGHHFHSSEAICVHVMQGA